LYYSPLQYSVLSGRLGFVQALLQFGTFEPDLVQIVDGSSTSSGTPFMKRRAVLNLEERDEDGDTLIMSAIKHASINRSLAGISSSRLEIIKLIIKAGGNVHAVRSIPADLDNIYGRTF
jgi:ankyrin repeat protein